MEVGIGVRDSQNARHLEDKLQIGGRSGGSSHGSKMAAFTNRYTKRTKNLTPWNVALAEVGNHQAHIMELNATAGARERDAARAGEVLKGRNEEKSKSRFLVCLPDWSEPSKQYQCSTHHVGVTGPAERDRATASNMVREQTVTVSLHLPQSPSNLRSGPSVRGPLWIIKARPKCKAGSK